MRGAPTHNLHIERSNVTPKSCSSPHRSAWKSRASATENPCPSFSSLLLHTLQQYFEQQRPTRFEAHMQLQYINSASTMGLRALFALLDRAGHQGTDIRVVWAYDAEDDAIEELGMDLVEDYHHVQLERQPPSLA